MRTLPLLILLIGVAYCFPIHGDLEIDVIDGASDVTKMEEEMGGLRLRRDSNSQGKLEKSLDKLVSPL